MFDSFPHPMKLPVVRVNPPEGTFPDIHAILLPPALWVNWISVPASVRVTVSVSMATPAVVIMSYKTPSPVSVIPLFVVFLKNRIVAIDQPQVFA